MTSFHPEDVKREFCANCDEFHDGHKRGWGGIKYCKCGGVMDYDGNKYGFCGSCGKNDKGAIA
jgi:hypothetical protein